MPQIVDGCAWSMTLMQDTTVSALCWSIYFQSMTQTHVLTKPSTEHTHHPLQFCGKYLPCNT